MSRDPLSDPTPGLMLHNGKLVRRSVGFVTNKSALRCAFGHAVRGDSIVHEGAITLNCKHQIGGRGEACNAALFVMIGLYKGRIFRADVTIEEARAMDQRGWTTDQILEYLGANYEPPRQEAS